MGRFAGAGVDASVRRARAAPRPIAEPAPAPALRRPGWDSGTSIVGTLVGFLIMLTLLLFAAQVLVRLYATSTLTAVAARAAEDVAESPDPSSEMRPAVTEARQQLGTFGATRTRFDWLEVDARQVVLEVRGNAPTLVPLPGRWHSITRTVTIRTERFR